jgi:hypothetical protein
MQNKYSSIAHPVEVDHMTDFYTNHFSLLFLFVTEIMDNSKLYCHNPLSLAVALAEAGRRGHEKQ